MQYQIINADCIEAMRAMPDNSVDSIVCDPPYELSDDGKQSPARVFLEFAFPQNAKIEAHRTGGCELAAFVREVLCLNIAELFPGPAPAVPVVAVTLDNQAPFGQDNIEDAPKGAIGITPDAAISSIEAQPAQHLGCFSLKFTDAAKMLQVLHEVGTGFISGGLGVGTTGGAPRFPSFAGGLASIVSGHDDVGSIHSAFSDLVRTSGGATDSAVFSFGLAGGAVERFSANAALLFASILHAGGAQLVRTAPAAARLSSMLEPRRVRVVDHTTGGAFTFDLLVHLQSVASMGFMGKAWDGSKIAFNIEMWKEALRVLKPGGHLLAFSGSRTYHRMTCAIEDAGFEVRDQIMWVYGSGFPKSLDVSKAIDKAAGHTRATEYEPNFGNATFGKGLGGGKHNAASEPAVTDAARHWEGWGTALKPAHEPICVARKPIQGTVAANVLAFRTGAINIDACRVHGDDAQGGTYTVKRLKPGATLNETGGNWRPEGDDAKLFHGEMKPGRWPANIIHDGSDEVLALFPAARSAGNYPSESVTRDGVTSFGGKQGQLYADTGSAARFFYCAKASRADRNAGMGPVPAISEHGATLRDIENAPKVGNNHPTVKPTALMAYLVRLVTPPGGLVLDPFMGSGSTGKACVREGFRFIGCELSAEYAAIADARILHELVGDIL